MYELGYTAIRLDDWNDYFVSYKESGDIKFYNEFLHFYEPVLDDRARRFIRRFELEDYRAEDLKQIFSTVLWNELQTYDSKLPMLQMVKYKVLSAWHEYVRINCGNFQPDNSNQYMMLRNIARLYYQKNDGRKTIRKIIAEIADELSLSEKSVETYVTAVATFKPKYNTDFYTDDEDDEFFAPIPDNYTTEDWFFRLQQKERLIAALSKLKKTEQKLIEYKFGICLNCLGNKSKLTMSEASMALDLTESGAEKKLKKILKTLKIELQE